MYSREKSNARGFFIIIWFYPNFVFGALPNSRCKNIYSGTPSVAFGIDMPLCSGVAGNLAVAETRRM
jgi:hypothetical protein